MALFLWDEFGKHVTIQSISRALASVGWSKKAAQQIAKEQNADLRDYYPPTLKSASFCIIGKLEPPHLRVVGVNNIFPLRSWQLGWETNVTSL